MESQTALKESRKKKAFRHTGEEIGQMLLGTSQQRHRISALRISTRGG